LTVRSLISKKRAISSTGVSSEVMHLDDPRLSRIERLEPIERLVQAEHFF
jgi:hypothetical protein